MCGLNGVYTRQIVCIITEISYDDLKGVVRYGSNDVIVVPDSATPQSTSAESK